jgi:tetratricopeptide (TPR) repeat protein
MADSTNISSSLNELSLTTEYVNKEAQGETGPTKPMRCVLEDYKKCSESHLWKLMMSFYDRKGPDSWSQGIVPHFITCNAFIGRAYAKVLQGFIADCMKPDAKLKLDITEPLYIIELGAGSGKFSYYMLKALDEMQKVCDFPMDKIVFVMTDFTEKNFDFWKDHPSLKDYFDSGRLDAAIFDAVEDDSITLWRSKIKLEKDTVKNPMCIVANYLFDTLYHDIFQVDAGQLKEGLVSTGSKELSEPDPLEPEIIGRLDNHYKYLPIDVKYYSEEDGEELHFERILQWYVDYFKDQTQGASLLIPVGALRALRRLTAISHGQAIIISGDKGNNNPDQFIGLMDPHIAVHGSFSLMVNYHAIGTYFTSRGGFSLHNHQEEASLKVSCFVLSPHGSTSEWTACDMNSLNDQRMEQFPYLSTAFRESVEAFGPNDFFVLQKSLKEDTEQPPLRAVVALLKLGDWDPDVFFKFRDLILNNAPSCGQKLRNDLCRGIPRVWENYFAMDMEKDIAFEIGRFYYGIRDYENALKYYKISTEEIGPHHVTYHNQGLCYYSKGMLQDALEYFAKSKTMNAGYEKAKNWHEKVLKELESKDKEFKLPVVPGGNANIETTEVDSNLVPLPPM